MRRSTDGALQDDLAQHAAPGISFARELKPAPLTVEGQAVTARLYERLTPEVIAEVDRRVAEHEELRGHYESVPSDARQWMVLSFGIWLGIGAVSELTGLPAVQPPDEVHAMARGPFAAAGGLYEADLVASCLESCGEDITAVRSALDFGCSSGRVLRVLSAAYPTARWLGCDANAPAIQWAKDNLPGVEAFVSSDAPPLAVEDNQLDLVYAISVWSHFEPMLGLRWFDEMHRVLRPGGHLVFTTHGLSSVAFDATRWLRPHHQADEIAGAIYRRGYWFAYEFGPSGDWGVINPGWGTTFVSSEWLLTQLCSRWTVLEFAPGRLHENQDVYVLRRR
jgi:SAM-dependent methyltransferase